MKFRSPEGHVKGKNSLVPVSDAYSVAVKNLSEEGNYEDVACECKQSSTFILPDLFVKAYLLLSLF